MDLTLMRTLPKLDKDVKPGSFVTVGRRFADRRVAEFQPSQTSSPAA
jgi:hypothetical protein